MAQLLANPIYDSAFKYMMQNERAAKVLISNLLEKEVDELRLLTNDTPIIDRDELRILRLDFSAKIRDRVTGISEIVTIELQKAYLDSEVMRFRNYLARQYADLTNTEKKIRETIRKNKESGEYEHVKVETVEPLHIIAIYFLGNGFEDILGTDNPIIYNYANPVGVDGMPILGIKGTLFFRALTHDSIIVRINCLKENAKTKVEQMLEVFVQGNVSQRSNQLLEINDIDNKSEEFRELARPLIYAVADSDVRKKMDMEDEINIYLRDIAIIKDEHEAYASMNKELKEELAATIEELSAKDKQLSAKDKQLSAKDKQLSAKDKQLSAKDEQLSAKDEQISNQQEQLTAVNEQLVKSIKLLYNSNVPLDKIAATLSISFDEVKNRLT